MLDCEYDVFRLWVETWLRNVVAMPLAVFLCSDVASQIAGADIAIDGGWTAE